MTNRSSRLRWPRSLLATSLLGVATLALGMDAKLGPTEIGQAVKAGTAMVSPRNGYIAKPYVLHEYNSGVRIDPASPIVDALTIGTPYERVRYYSYLEAYQGKSVAQGGAAKVAQANADRLTILAFTHSPVSVQAEQEAWQQTYVKHGNDQEVQRTYLDDFKPATLTVNGRIFTSTVKIDGPYQDAFTVQGKPDFRYLGVISYVFDLTPLVHNGQVAGVGELRFKDPTGKVYAQRIDLARYR